MVRRKDEMISEVRNKMRGGNGEVTITHLYKKDELKGHSRLCAKMILEPGASVGTHIHEKEEEIYYILKGTGVVIDAGVPVNISEGDAIMTRDGASHSIENTGDTVLEFMAVINLYE